MFKLLLRANRGLNMRKLNNELNFKESLEYYKREYNNSEEHERKMMHSELEYAKIFLNLKEKPTKPPAVLYFQSINLEHSFFSILKTLFKASLCCIIVLSIVSNDLVYENFTKFLDISSHIKSGENSAVKFSDVQGIDECREELQDIVDFLKNPQKFQEAGARVPRGVLLTGEPGTGKTLLAKAIAGEAGVKFYYSSGSEFDEMIVGLGTLRMRELFKKARENAPCIIFIDEIDSLSANRSMRGTPYRQVLNQLLVEMDGFKTSDEIIVIGATNMPTLLDSALKRSGRFDLEIHVPLPDIEGRRKILDLYLAKIKHSPDLDKDIIVKKLQETTGAVIANVVNIAALNAVNNNREVCEDADFDYAIDRITIGIEHKSLVITEDELYMTSVHELGHAFISYLNGFLDIHKITIKSKGMALGHTAYLQKTDSKVISEEQLIKVVETAVAGRAAEEVFFGKDNITSGCQNDLVKATEIIYYGVKAGLFHKELGVGCYENLEKIGEEKRDEIDTFAMKLIEKAYERVKITLKKNQKKIRYLAKDLMKNNTLYKIIITSINSISNQQSIVIPIQTTNNK